MFNLFAKEIAMPLPMYGTAKEKTAPSLIGCTIAVASGKGGVGKSTVAVNLALALKKQGLRVGVMDTDIYGPSIRKMLPEDRMPGQKGQRLTPALSKGICLMSMAYFKQENEAAIIRAPIANGVISQFVHQVDWGDLDYLIIDFPPGTGDIQLTLCQQANITCALMVTTPQEVALMDVKKSMNLFDQVNIPVLGMTENMSGLKIGDVEVFPFGKGGGERLARETGVPFLGSVPVDPMICQKADRGESIFDEDCPGSKAFQSLASKVQLEVKGINSPSLNAFELEWKEMV